MKAILSHFVGKPWLLFATLFLATSLALPYSGIRHDARLYAAQCLHAYDGRFAEDLFFEYGSQSKFSLFPMLVGQVVGRVGVDVPFFLLTIMSIALLVGSIQRLIVRLFGDSVWTIAALLVMSVQPIALGGNGNFFIQETFLTARLPALAVSLFALERMLVQRWRSTGVLLVIGMILHPLMTMPAVVLLAFTWMRSCFRMQPRIIVVVLLIVSMIAALTMYFVGPYRLFGHFDAEWHAALNRIIRFPNPMLWELKDYSRLSIALASLGLLCAAKCFDAAQRSFLVMVAVTAVVGLGLAVLASHLEWALLYQGQAFRWVWPLEVLYVPCLVMLAKFYCERKQPGDGLVAGTLMLSAAGWPLNTVTALVGIIAVVVSAVVLVRLRSRGDDPREQSHFKYVLILGSLVMIGFSIREIIEMWHMKQIFMWDQSLNLAERGHVWWHLIGTVPKLGMVALLSFFQYKLIAHAQLRVLCLIALAVVVQVAWFACCQSAWATRQFDAGAVDRKFVAEYITEHHPSERLVVYYPGSRPEANWLRLNVSMYFDQMQLGGQAFNRETAMEGRRRALLVRAFEIAQIRKTNDPPWVAELNRPGQDNIYETSLEFPEPTLEDFQKLLCEAKIDLIVLDQAYAGWAATNGTVYIYDRNCHHEP